MQDVDLLDFAQNDPKGFLYAYSRENAYGIIIDEAQYAPVLFKQIKVEVDKNSRAGYFVLSGSQNFLLHEQISESLSGRVSIYTLLPLSLKELSSAGLLTYPVEEILCKGFYPRVYSHAIDEVTYYENYNTTYIERDIRRIRNIDNFLLFKKCMKLCVMRIGSTLNLTDLAAECGISQPTLKSWLSLLEASYVIFFLPPYHTNLGKRLVKSPKIYFYDIGLALALLGISKDELLIQRSLYGAIFENMVIVDCLKNSNAVGAHAGLSFFRSSTGDEVDLVLELFGKTIPVEIKFSETLQSRFFKTINWFNDQVKSASQPVLIYGGDKDHIRSGVLIISWKSLPAQLIKK